jgi:uncharacterized protein HemX
MADNKRSSLVDDSFNSVGSAKKTKKSSGGSGKALKLVIIVIGFAVAGLGIAYTQGVFEAPPKPVVRTAEDQKTADDFQKASENLRKSPAATSGGS